jgi:hypothetical protein
MAFFDLARKTISFLDQKEWFSTIGRFILVFDHTVKFVASFRLKRGFFDREPR